MLHGKITADIFTLFSLIQHSHLPDNMLEYKKHLF